MVSMQTLFRHLRRPPRVYVRRAQQKLAQRNRQPIFINGLFKSASTFVYDNMAHGLFRNSSLPLSHNHVLLPERLDLLLRERTICHDHMPPTAFNLQQINGKLDRMVVHVRDPRQSVLSWLMAQEIDGKAGPFNNVTSTTIKYLHDFMPHYYRLTMSQKIDLHIENRLSFTIDWIDGWVRAEADRGFSPRILFIQQEEMGRDGGHDVFRRILDFYGINHALFDFPSPPVPGKHQFRKGDPNEWRSVFTQEQAGRIVAMIPDHLFDKFGWER